MSHWTTHRAGRVTLNKVLVTIITPTLFDQCRDHPSPWDSSLLSILTIIIGTSSSLLNRVTTTIIINSNSR